MTYQSPLLKTLAARGFIKDITKPEVLDAKMAENPVKGYVGFDATAPALHAGSLIQLMLLRHLILHGHQAVVLIGDATTRIGDPTGRDEARPVLEPEIIHKNAASLTDCIKKILPDAEIVCNSEWFADFGFLDFLTNYAKDFSVNELIKKETFATRLQNNRNLSLQEFCYTAMQATDFHILYKKAGVSLQLGGSDQYGNITAGIDLGRRHGAQLFGITSPLLTTGAGQKMGKSRGNPVWLDAEHTTPFEFWQYWRNTPDADAERFLKLFTTLDIAAIADLRRGDVNAAKQALATEVTNFLHPGEGDRAARTAAAVFTSEGDADALPRVAIEPETGILTALVKAGFCASNSEARRKIREGAVKLAGNIVYDEKLRLGDLGAGVRLSFGKKKHCMLVE